MKNVHPVSCAGIRTHDLLNTSLLPCTPDKGSRPWNKTNRGHCDSLIRFWASLLMNKHYKENDFDWSKPTRKIYLHQSPKQNVKLFNWPIWKQNGGTNRIQKLYSLKFGKGWKTVQTTLSKQFLKLFLSYHTSEKERESSLFIYNVKRIGF